MKRSHWLVAAAMGWLSLMDCGGVDSQAPALGTAMQAATIPTGNVIANPSFESNLTGWMSWQGSLSRVSATGAPQGSYVAQVTRNSGVTQYSIDDNPETVTASIAGATYRATVYVKAANSGTANKPIVLGIKERTQSYGAVSSAQTSPIALKTSWQQLQISLRAQGSGNLVDVYVMQASAASGNAFQVDALSLEPLSVPSGNLTANPSFESDSTGWYSWNGTLTRAAVTNGPDGAYAAQVSSDSASFSIDDDPDTFPSTTAGRTYRAAAWVRAANSATVGKPLTINLREVTQSYAQVQNQASPSINLSNSWQKLEVTLTVQATGNRLESYILLSSGGAGCSFYADGYSIVQEALTSNVPERGQYAIGADAWASASISTESLRHDWAVFHAPESPDTTSRDEYLAADSTSKAFVYQNWGMSCNDAGWTTCPFSTSYARGMGYTAKFKGAEYSGWSGLMNLDAGKAGYGDDWAAKALARVNPTGPWHGVFLDDFNISYAGAPTNNLGVVGVPDGYASVTAYRDAVRTQFNIAISKLRDSGYLSLANLSGITEWDMSRFGPNDDLVGLADYTMIEFCGTWGNGSSQWSSSTSIPQDRIVTAGQTAASRGKKLLCLSHATSSTDSQRTAFNDLLTRIVTEPGYGAGDIMVGTDYLSPFPWTDSFKLDYGVPTGAIQKSGSHYWRSYSSGKSLHVDFATLQGWVTTP